MRGRGLEVAMARRAGPRKAGGWRKKQRRGSLPAAAVQDLGRSGVRCVRGEDGDAVSAVGGGGWARSRERGGVGPAGVPQGRAGARLGIGSRGDGGDWARGWDVRPGGAWSVWQVSGTWRVTRSGATLRGGRPVRLAVCDAWWDRWRGGCGARCWQEVTRWGGVGEVEGKREGNGEVACCYWSE